ncbi:MAG: hypothetical protein FWB86_01810 [Treponema sp.]|nr:hypothetical protein [Treponema sp.]MCL2250780.1 hypothetical protein [Treponema sp.]
MIKKGVFSLILLFFCLFSLSAQGSDRGVHQQVIRGEVYIDFEPIYAGHADSEYPLDFNKAAIRALEEAAMFFSAMIYGWSFNYEVGERARRINEKIELDSIAQVQFGDPALKVTETEIRDMQLRVWADYHLNDAASRRMNVWRSGTIRNAQAIGYGPSHLDEYPGWLAVKKMALEDAARAALRAMLRGSERNRPKEVTGLISLASFPRYYVDAGRWAVSARFRVKVENIIPFAVH